ncbi:hypothetical protein K431DRAFT_265843 [Polychaeton citri CBS 116435]|uniref:Magnesium transporter n=1 Tax=Polychaeton citri CBS 116435 TaxID=1314669 RepID=A0A9P4URN0_9PEZI|nr:hypothetical protein K431DRAFT_265843 [Polychaeton citri CBS 116435]
MGVASNALNIVGVIFLSHAVYSAHEHSLLPTASFTTSNPLPLDIFLETILSVFALCLGVVISSPQLKPIQWSTWAGKLERDTSSREVKEAGQIAGNPYAALEERPGFLDVRGARKGFQAWVADVSGATGAVKS